MGLHAVGFVLVGARSYTAVDPILKLDKDKFKNLRTRPRNPKLAKQQSGWTLRQIMRAHPRVSFIPGTFEDVAPDRRFDVALMHNVTEHLMNIEDVFRGVWQRLRPDGLLVFSHHNYYCWNGHHQSPKRVRDLDADDPEQRRYADWAHLDPDPVAEQWLSTRVNRIRLRELRLLTERYFEIETWEPEPIDAEHGAGRLTDEIRRRYPQYSEAELTTQHIFCRARRRAQPASDAAPARHSAGAIVSADERR